MDNNQIPPVQPLQPEQPLQPLQPLQPPQPMQPEQPLQSMQLSQPSSPVLPPANGLPQVLTPDGRPMVQQSPSTLPNKKNTSSLVKTIVIIALSLLSVTFIGLFIWIAISYNQLNANVQEKINTAVASAKDEEATKLEAEFLEREKLPHKTFAGPIDYGELTFDYPKTWSVYISADASNGGNFEAYFNPGQIEPVNGTSINALRVQILDQSFENVVRSYVGALSNPNKPLKMESITVNGTSANLYTGAIPGTELNGLILVIKIRDKTAVLRTDSMLFEADFKNLIETIRFNA